MSATQVERQPREHPVPCAWCRTPTFALSAICDRCNPPAGSVCKLCKGERVIERRNYGRNALEATTLISCPRCRNGKPVRATS